MSFNAALTQPVEATISSGQFRPGYPFCIVLDSSVVPSVPVFVVLSRPGTGRSFFDCVRLVSEPRWPKTDPSAAAAFGQRSSRRTVVVLSSGGPKDCL